MASLTQDVDLAPLRNVDDFALGAARFALPPYKDMDRWANRILKNLIYYQTNYFAIILAFFLLISLIHPREMVLGFVVLVAGGFVLLYATSKHPDAVQFKKEHPLVSLGVILLVGYLTICALGCVITFLFGLALPMLVMFIHASCRLRNFANKIANKTESLGLKKTVMAHILNLIGFDINGNENGDEK